MKRSILTITALMLLSLISYGQDQEKYTSLVAEASRLYESKDYLMSGYKYSEAFVALDDKGSVVDRYNAACSYALATEPDSAFIQLFRIAQKGNFSNYGHLNADPDLQSLHADERWEKLNSLVKENKEKMEKNFDKPLVEILESIYQEDQQYRQQIGEVEKEYGRDSDEMKAHWKTISHADSLNLIKVREILDDRGWLGSEIIGQQGNATLFLVIQHADLAVQEQYLPMMREAVTKGNANPSSLALLEDRVALRKGKRQIYGSQIGRDPETGDYYVSPLEDPDNVDQRRASMGLPPLSNYISHWGMSWDVEAYKASLPEIEAKQQR